MSRAPAPPSCPLCASTTSSLLHADPPRVFWRCPVCTLVFLDPAGRPTPLAEALRYAQHENDPADERYRAHLGRLVEPLRSRLAPGARGLDYGCGPGPTLSLLLEEAGFPTSVFDPFFAADRAVLEHRYDFVTCSETVEHFHDPAAEFVLLDRLVRPGGWLAVMTGMLASPDGFADWWYHRDPTHVVFFGPETMRWLGRRFGWSVEFPARDVTLFHKRR